MQEYPKHYCGVFGVYGHPNAAELTYYGLYALQHRGQESAGIVTSDGNQFHAHKGMGLVPQVFVAGSESDPAMFANDESRIKVRHFVAVGVADFRALYKSNNPGGKLA